MLVQRARLGVAVFFAAAAAALFARDWLFPAAVLEQFRPGRLRFGAWFALVLAGWNAARWYVNWSDPRARPAAAPNPLAVRRPADRDPGPPNPDLDFLNLSDAARPFPKPSPNGDHKG